MMGQLIHQIDKAMVEQKLNARKLAARMGVSEVWVHKILTAKCNPTVATLVKIANALDYRIEFKLVKFGRSK